MASLLFPLVAMLPALALNFSPMLLGAFLLVIALLVFRFFFIFALWSGSEEFSLGKFVGISFVVVGVVPLQIT